MKNQNRYEELFDSFLDLTEFALVKYHNGFGLKDLQGGNLGNIETERFSDAGQIVDRMESYIEDYLVTPILENLPYYVGEALTWGEIAEMLLNSAGDSEGDVTMLDAIINHSYDIRLDNCTHEEMFSAEQISENSALLLIDAETVLMLEDLMNKDCVDYWEHDFDEFETVCSWTAYFADGHIADIKVCTGQDECPPWSEAVLFRKNEDGSYSEAARTDPEVSIAGSWELYDGEKKYTVKVEAKEKTA